MPEREGSFGVTSRKPLIFWRKKHIKEKICLRPQWFLGGKFNKKAIVIPNMTVNTEKIIDVKMVILKLKDNCRAVSGGIINMAETSIIPRLSWLKPPQPL
jgi:hypothetical protein